MQILVKTSESTKVVKTTETCYPIEGFDPDMVVLEMITTTVDDKDPHIEYRLIYGIGTRYRPTLVKKEFFDLIKKLNPFDYREKAFKDVIVNVEDVVINDENQTVYIDLGELEMVWFDYSSSILMDKEGLYIPYARIYDYIGTYFNNRDVEFNDEFLNFLKNHPWVVNKDDLKYENIPYYNAEEDYNETVVVVVCPDKETYNKMAVEAKKNEKMYWSCYLNDYIVSTYQSKKDWFGIAPYLKYDHTFEDMSQ